MLPQQILAAIGLATCLVLLLRMVIGERRRQGMDAAARRFYLRLRLASTQWRLKRHRSLHAESDAREEAARIIEQARRRAGSGQEPGTRDGNVIRPERFGKRRNDLH